MSTTTEEAPVAEAYQRRQTPLEKTTETEARSSLATVYTCMVDYRQKSGFQPIKLELYPLVHTYPANYVRVHLRISGYIKRVEWRTESFGLGLAKV